MTRMVILIGMLLVGALGMNATTAQVDTTPEVQFTAYPVGDHANRWFQVEVGAGGSVTLTAGVANKGDASVALRSFVANANTALNGGFSAGIEGDALAGPARWVDFTPESFEVAPGAGREWNFTVSVPAGTPAGQYVAAIVVSTAGDVTVPGSDTFRQVLRTTMAIEITVPGPVSPAFEAGTPALATDVTGQVLDVPITNTGNVFVAPKGDLVLRDINGNAVFTASIAMGTVYVGHTTSIQLPLPTAVAPGEYRLSLEMTDSATGVHDSILERPITVS